MNTLLTRKIELYFILSCLFILVFSCQTKHEPYTTEQLSQTQKNYSPKFIPNNEDILYVNDASGNPELWQLSKSGKPRQVTDLKQRINNLEVAPDGSFAVFAVDNGGDERYDMYRYDISSGEIKKQTNTIDVAENGYSFSPDGNKIAMQIDIETPFREQIFIYDLKTTSSKQVTKGEVPVVNPIWSNNADKIAAVRTAAGKKGELLLFNLENSKTDTIRPLIKDNIFNPITFSADDSSILCLSKNDKGFDQLTLINTATHEVKLIGPSDWDVFEVIWGKNAGIYFTQNVSGRMGLYHMLTPQSTVEEVLPPKGIVRGLSLNKEENKLLFSKEDATHPQEIYSLDLKTKQIQQLTHSVPPTIEASRLSMAEPFKVNSFDNTPIQGFLYKPTEHAEEQLPAVLVVHGGPSGQDVDRFNSLTQSLTQAGFVVFNINYRGSIGYGKAFQDLNNKDWGGGDLKDFKAVLQHFIDQGLVDKNKIGITGGSFGGYLSYMALTKDADFYAAGVPCFGMVDLIADYNLVKDRWGLWYETEMGTPKTDSLLFVDRSAIHFIDNLKAHILIFQGENDTNVPKWSSDMFVEKLKSLNKPVDYVVYPDEGHGFVKRVNRIDWIQKTVAFFEQNLKDSK